MRKKSTITLVIILVIIGFAIWAMNRPVPDITKDVAICIGENSVLYTQLGCHACETQENLFGDYYDSLNVVDCFAKQDECLLKNIQGTPTWIIDEKKYVGVQSISRLKELTGC